jgi:BNR repeat-like domain
MPSSAAGMKVRLLGILLACVLMSVATASAAPAPPFSAPVQIGFRAGDDWEPSIAADRYGHVYALWTHYSDPSVPGQSDPACQGCASPHMELQVSADGGATWSAPRPLTPGTQLRQDDPQIVVDPVDGRTVYAAYMLGEKASQYVAKSIDFGQTWTSVLVEPLQRGTDKDILAVRGPHVYLVYNAVQKIWASVSHDGGETWSTNHVIANTNSKFGWSLPGGGGIDSKGHAYFAWEGFEGNGKPSGEVNLFVTRSTDGGETWSSHLVDVSQAPPRCGTCGWAYWGPQTTLALDARDRVYVLYNANTTKYGPNRMRFARSTDGAQSWDRRRDVSAAPAGSNNLFPAIVAPGDGDVRVAWMDDRNGFDTGNDDPNARWNVYYLSSTDGGATWSPETKLSQFVPGYPYKHATPLDGFGQPYGDYFELDVDGAGRTHALWGEGPSYNGPGNVWYARSR